jgi:protein involved in polysaccharide export with SLBB domain
MHKISIILLTFIFGLGLGLGDLVFAQVNPAMKSRLAQENITSDADVKAELAKRNMTEGDARRMAKNYGMDYDQFISTYITGNKSVPSKTKVTELKESKAHRQLDVVKDTLQSDSTAKKEQKKIKKLETTKDEKAGTQSKSADSLQYFGYDIFQSIPQAFEPSSAGAIDPGYIIGPGDVLRLYLWGDVELQYELTVDDQGTVFIPTAGQVNVSGIQYSDLQKKLTNYLSKFYAGLASRPQKVFLDISIAKLRPIKIFALGEVARPGAYNISSFATVFNALYSVGGPTTKGSLREIRVLRHNKVVAKVDIYDYLLKGQLFGDVRLQNNDVIFIPARGKTVTIKGEVLRNAIYELKEGEGIKDLVNFAGGLKATAYTGRVQLNRIKPFSQRAQFGLEREVKDVDLSSLMYKKGADFPLYDGDILTIFPILDKVDNYVTVNGSVYRPGTYELSKVPRLSDLIRNAYGIMPETYLGKADVIRTRPDESMEFLTVDLAKALDGDKANDIELKSRDQVKIYSMYELVDKKFVSISGYVKNPTSIPYADSLTLYDMVFRAGGLQDPVFRGKAFTLRADLVRINPDGLTTRIIPFGLDSLLRTKQFNMKLEPGDKIYIYKADVEKILDKYVTVEGEVRAPGRIDLSTNMHPMDAILQAGGFTEKSLRTKIYINRLKPSGYNGDKISESVEVNLPLDFTRLGISGQSSADSATGLSFRLQHKDVIVVRKNPNYEDQRVVVLGGEVKYPGTYVMENRNEKLADLINKAGGPTTEAYLSGASFIRNGKKVNVDVEALYKDKDEDADIYLHDLDSVYIPRQPNAVYVTGEVNNPGYIKFTEGDNVKDYIAKAGGMTNDGDYAIYQKANGESRRVNFGFLTANPKVYDGSVITVTKLPPKEPDTSKVDVGGTIKDIFAIVTSAVTIIVLAKQIK